MTLREIAAKWLAADATHIAQGLNEGVFQKVTYGEKNPSRLTKALLETADDMRRVGILNSASHEKITLRHLGSKADSKGIFC